jgi:hypothetical protein
MKRGLIFAVFALILSLSFASAAPTFDIVKNPINKIVIKELSMPAVYNLTIKNNGIGDFFRIDTLLDVMIYPRDAFPIGNNEEKTITIRIFPKSTEKNRYYGDWSFRYFFKGDNTGILEDNIIVRILSLKDVLSLKVPNSVKSDDTILSAELSNNENISLYIKLNFDSTLLSYTDNFTINPLEKKEIRIPLDAEKLSREAGAYNLKVSIIANNEAELPIVKDLILESNVLITSDIKTESSTFTEKTTFTKKNDGNTPTMVTVTAERTMIQSLITSFNAKPDSVSRKGGVYDYKWERKLNPSEELKIEMKTNYALPWILLIVLLVCYAVVRRLTKKRIIIKKKAYRVKTKSGQFAAKVILLVKNTGKEVSNAKIIESIPPFTEIMGDRFGTIKPAEIRKHSVIWDIPFMAAKEEFILSYIVYSKVSILGKIDVAPAIATYQITKDRMQESKSNSIFILTEEKQPEAQAELVK